VFAICAFECIVGLSKLSKIGERRTIMKISRKWLSYLLGVTVLLTSGMLHAQTIPDLSIWMNTWFKGKGSDISYKYSDIGVNPVPPYLDTDHNVWFAKITNWDSNLRVLSLDIFVKDDFGNWDPTPFITFNCNYFGGTNKKFVCWYHSIDPSGSVRSGMLLFKGKLNKAGNFVLGGETYFKTLAGYQGWIDDDPSSTDRMASKVIDLNTGDFLNKCSKVRM
jgi:hypothetical protein